MRAFFLALCIGFVQSAAGETFSRFTPDQIESGAFVAIKHSEWHKCHRRSARLFFRSGADTPLTDFLESRSSLDHLAAMEEKGLKRGEVSVAPWSGDFWPYASGLLGMRSFDRAFKKLKSWPDRYKYIKENDAKSFLDRYGIEGVTQLSPAEKYDMLMNGLGKLTLTNSMWLQGKLYYDQYGKVDEWMGICHGWSAAAIMAPRPERAVDVTSWDRRWTLHLVPSEIKGIVSNTWANNPYGEVTIGERCNKKDPERDENGRLIDPECFDLNPGVWHRAVVNQIGIAGKSFVMDATYDYEVWNFPLKSYQYYYFNVNTGDAHQSMDKAVVVRESIRNDRFEKYRSKEARHIIGVVMVVTYVVETANNDSENDSPGNDVDKMTEYRYDLELDEDGKIIGGEWYDIRHPDFIWRPLNQAAPLTPWEAELRADWDGEGVMPDSWVNAAEKSARRGMTLNAISKVLLKRAQNGRASPTVIAERSLATYKSTKEGPP